LPSPIAFAAEAARELLYADVVRAVISCVSIAFASIAEADRVIEHEAVVGWSADGDTVAVIVTGASENRPMLSIRKRNDQLATYLDDHEDAPDAGVKSIDVEKWAPLASHKLKKVDVAAARERCAATYTVTSVGKTRPGGGCIDGGFAVKKRTQTIHTELPPTLGCYEVIGGLAHPNGKRGAVQVVEINSAPGEGTRVFVIDLK